MSERLKGFVVTLDCDIREEDAETIVNAICALKHVVDVSPVSTDIGDSIVRMRLRHELLHKVVAVIGED